MRHLRALAFHSLRANLRHRQGLFAAMALLVAIVPVFLGMQDTISKILKSGPLDLVRPHVTDAIGLSGYLVALLCVVFLGVMLGIGPLTQEKAKGALEALLATPVSPWTVWWGKFLGGYLPSVFIGIPSSLGVIWALEAAVIAPSVGRTLLPTEIVAVVVIGVPILGLGIAALVNLLGLILPNPNMAALGMVLVVIAVSNALPPAGIGFSSWAFVSANAGVGIAVLLISLALASRLLTKERIVLSARRI